MKARTYTIKFAVAVLMGAVMASCASISDEKSVRAANPIFEALVTDVLEDCTDTEKCPPEPIQSTTTFTIYDDEFSEYTCSGTTCYCFRPIFNGSDCNVMKALHCPNSDLNPHPGTPGVETCRCEQFCPPG